MYKVKKIFESGDGEGKIINKTLYELQKTASMLQEMNNGFFSKFNVSSTKFNLLVVLYNGSKEGMILSDIGEEMVITRASITGLVDRLEKQNLVIRKRDAIDRRKIMALITNEGSVLVEEIIKEYKKWLKKVTMSIDDNEKEQLIDILLKIEKGLIKEELAQKGMTR